MFNISHKTELLRTLWMLLAICNWNDFQLLSSSGLLARFHFHTDGSPNSANVRHFSKAHKTQNEIEHCGTQVRLKPVTAGEKIDRFLWPIANKKTQRVAGVVRRGGGRVGLRTPNWTEITETIRVTCECMGMGRVPEKRENRGAQTVGLKSKTIHIRTLAECQHHRSRSNVNECVRAAGGSSGSLEGYVLSGWTARWAYGSCALEHGRICWRFFICVVFQLAHVEWSFNLPHADFQNPSKLLYHKAW